MNLATTLTTSLQQNKNSNKTETADKENLPPRRNRHPTQHSLSDVSLFQHPGKAVDGEMTTGQLRAAVCLQRKTSYSAGFVKPANLLLFNTASTCPNLTTCAQSSVLLHVQIITLLHVFLSFSNYRTEKARCNTDINSQCGKWFFSHSQLSVQTLFFVLFFSFSFFRGGGGGAFLLFTITNITHVSTPVQTLLWYLYSSHVQPHVSISTCTLNIQSAGSHTVIQIHFGWGWVPLLLWLLYPYKSKQPKFSTKDQWGIKTNISSKRNKNSFIVLFTKFSCAMSWFKGVAMFGLGWRSSVVLYWVVSSFLTRLFWPMYHSKPEAF